MKVLLISHYPPPAGGIASWTKRVLEIGLPNGWGVVHINSNMIGGRDPFKNTKISIKSEIIRSFKIWNQEIKALNDPEIKIVHTCIPCTPFGMLRECITGLIAKAKKKKFILHCRCTVPNVVNKSYKVLMFKVLGLMCDGIMTLNEKSYDFSKRNTKSNVVLIPNFVALDELSGEEKTEFSELKSAVYVGGVTPDKGCDIIIEAAKRLPSIEFNLIGNISDEIANMKVGDNVKLHGNCNKQYVQKMLKQADVFIFLSRFWGEGFSNALVEAMGAGLPCIVSDWAANKDMIQNDGGIVIDGTSVDQLVEGLEKLNGDPEARRKMSIRNVKKAVSDYSEKVILKAYVEFYETLLM